MQRRSMVIWRTAIPSHCSDLHRYYQPQIDLSNAVAGECQPRPTHVSSPACAFEKCYLLRLPEALRNSTALVVGSGEHTCIRVFDWYVALQILLLWFAQAGKLLHGTAPVQEQIKLSRKGLAATIFSNGVLCKSRKLAVLAEVALALARNRQAPGPLKTLKLSSYCRPPLAGPGSIPPWSRPSPPREEISDW